MVGPTGSGKSFFKKKLIEIQKIKSVNECISVDDFFEKDVIAKQIFSTFYKSYFNEEKLPARTCIGVTGLAVGASVEIDLIAKI